MANTNPPKNIELTKMQLMVMTLVAVSEKIRSPLSKLLALANISDREAGGSIQFLTNHAMAKKTSIDNYRSTAQNTWIKFRQTRECEGDPVTFLERIGGGCTILVGNKVKIDEFADRIGPYVVAMLSQETAIQPEVPKSALMVAPPAPVRPPALETTVVVSKVAAVTLRDAAPEMATLVPVSAAPAAAPVRMEPLPIVADMLRGMPPPAEPAVGTPLTPEELIDLLEPSPIKFTSRMEIADRMMHVRGFMDSWTHACDTAEEVARRMKERRATKLTHLGPILAGMEALQLPFPAP